MPGLMSHLKVRPTRLGMASPAYALRATTRRARRSQSKGYSRSLPGTQAEDAKRARRPESGPCRGENEGSQALHPGVHATRFAVEKAAALKGQRYISFARPSHGRQLRRSPNFRGKRKCQGKTRAWASGRCGCGRQGCERGRGRHRGGCCRRRGGPARAEARRDRESLSDRNPAGHAG